MTVRGDCDQSVPAEHTCWLTQSLFLFVLIIFIIILIFHVEI